MSICKSWGANSKKGGRTERPVVANLRDLKQIRSEALVGYQKRPKKDVRKG